jgi:hypothetical protein
MKTVTAETIATNLVILDRLLGQENEVLRRAAIYVG